MSTSSFPPPPPVSDPRNAIPPSAPDNPQEVEEAYTSRLKTLSEPPAPPHIPTHRTARQRLPLTEVLEQDREFIDETLLRVDQMRFMPNYPEEIAYRMEKFLWNSGRGNRYECVPLYQEHIRAQVNATRENRALAHPAFTAGVYDTPVPEKQELERIRDDHFDANYCLDWFFDNKHKDVTSFGELLDMAETVQQRTLPHKADVFDAYLKDVAQAAGIGRTYSIYAEERRQPNKHKLKPEPAEEESMLDKLLTRAKHLIKGSTNGRE